MKNRWSRGVRAFVVGVTILLLGLFCWWIFPSANTEHGPEHFATLAPNKGTVKPSSIPRALPNTRRLDEMTESEKADLVEIFDRKIKPAVDRWCKAYDGHAPFRPDEVTLERFHSHLHGFLYTFMIGDTTLTVASRRTDADARVFYVMTRDAARALNSVPQRGNPPILTLPISREEVLRMVKADTGVDYQPNQVVIKPTGAACALNGGAFVDVGVERVGDMIAAGSGLSFVVDSNGIIVNFQN